MRVSDRKLLLTLIGEGQARVGHVFKLIAVPEECKRCRLYSACMGKLKLRRRYRVVEVRRINLPRVERCLLTGEALVPVIVEELPSILAIPAGPNIVEGVVTTYVKVDGFCQDSLVKKFGGEPIEIANETKVKILRILGRERCGSRTYVVAEVLPLD